MKKKVDFQKVEKLRMDLGLGRVAFCRRARIGHQTYKRLSSGADVKDGVIIRVAKGLGVKPSEILYWEGAK